MTALNILFSIGAGLVLGAVIILVIAPALRPSSGGGGGGSPYSDEYGRWDHEKQKWDYSTPTSDDEIAPYEEGEE